MKSSFTIEDIEVDLEAIGSIEHHCRDGLCDRDTCCCAQYEICVGRHELSAVVGCIREAARFAPHVAAGDGLDNVFDEAGGGLFAIDTDEDGLCVFAYRKQRRILCSLHSAALHLGIQPHEVKPAACVLWPLAITEDRPLQLSVHEDAFSYDCNKERKKAGPDLCPSIAGIIRSVFGEGFARKVEKAAKRYCA